VQRLHRFWGRRGEDGANQAGGGGGGASELTYLFAAWKLWRWTFWRIFGEGGEIAPKLGRLAAHGTGWVREAAKNFP